MDQEIREKSVQGHRSISLLNSILWDQRISKENKVWIYNSTVKSILTYNVRYGI